MLGRFGALGRLGVYTSPPDQSHYQFIQPSTCSKFPSNTTIYCREIKSVFHSNLWPQSFSPYSLQESNWNAGNDTGTGHEETPIQLFASIVANTTLNSKSDGHAYETAIFDSTESPLEPQLPSLATQSLYFKLPGEISTLWTKSPQW